jgi:type I restriction enzyme S subunit
MKNSQLSTYNSQLVPPGYKQTEVGVIPEEWEVKRLGDLFEITSSKRVFQSEWKTEGIPFYRARELAVLGEKGYIKNELFISKEMYDVFKNVYGVPQIGDMLVTGVGTLGKVYVVSDDHKFYFKDGNIIWFKISGKVRPDFLRQLYLTQLIIKQIDDASAGTTVGTYTISGAKKTTIPFPNLAEQEAIAEALSDADALIESLEQLIAKKRHLKQGAMQQLLTGKTRLPGFHGEWEVKRLGDVGIFSKGRGIKKDEVVADALPCVRYGEIYTHHNDYLKAFNSFITQENAKQSQRIQKGDLLFAGSGETAEEIGKCVAFLGEEEAYAGGDIVIFSPVDQDSKFLGYLMNHSTVASQKARMGQGDVVVHISARNLARLELHLPAQPEQTAIATILTDMDSEIAALEAKLANARQIKQGMMQELLTGRIRLV